MVEGKDFIVDVRERTARGIWESAEQGEKAVDGTWPAESDRP